MDYHPHQAYKLQILSSHLKPIVAYQACQTGSIGGIPVR